MPNHFHLIIAVPPESSDRLTSGDRLTSSHPVTFNSSLAVMLRSYTLAISIQENRSGSLFRERNKAEWLGSIEGEKIKFENRNKAIPEPLTDLEEEYLHK